MSLALEVGALLVDLCLGAHDDAGDAEAALQAAARGERVGEPIALVAVDALERDHRLALDLGQRLLAADHRLAVDHAPCSTRTVRSASNRPSAR